jgi:phage terminase large subunit-like protein
MTLNSYVAQTARRIQHQNSNRLAYSSETKQYSPVNAKAEEFHKSKAKVRILPGGNQSGKTTTVSQDHVAHARNMPPGCQGIALTNTYKDIGKNLWPAYKEWLNPDEWEWGAGNQRTDNPTLIFLKKNGYKLYFGSYEQGRQAHQGAKWWYVHFDEEAPEDIYDEVYRGTLAHHAPIGYSYTPLNGITYTTERLIPLGLDPSQPNFWAPKEPMSLLENPHVSQEEIRLWMESLSDKSIQTRIYGYAVSMEGVVYDEFDPNIHVCNPFPIPASWKLYRCIDFGWEHPTVSLILASDGFMLYVVDEYYQNHRHVSDHAASFKIQEQLLEIVGGGRPRLLGISDHDAQLRAEYLKVGIHTKAARKEPLLGGIEVVRNLLKVRSSGEPRLKVFRGCKHTIREFGLYHYPGKDKKGRMKEGEKAEHPVKEHDHCMDLIRYGTVEQFGFFEELRHKIEIAR